MSILTKYSLLLLVHSFIIWKVEGQTAKTVSVIEITRFGVVPDSFLDATPGVCEALEAARTQPGATLNFPKGRYDFWPDNAEEHTYYISNTSTEDEYPSKKQRAGLFLKNLKNLTIEGNGSLFVFHGKLISWLLDSCENIRLQHIRVDYERPGMSEMTLREVTPTQVLAAIHPDSRFAILDGTLHWYGEKWKAANFHAVLVDTATGVNLYSDWDPFLNSKAEVIAPLLVRFKGDFSRFKGKVGEVLTVRDRYRDYVGALVNRSKNISLDDIHMHYMHGLGIISQFSENLHYQNVTVAPRPGSGRVIASSADGMHFSGCKGQITIENCHFQGLHDDAINVHGTHLVITELLGTHRAKVRFMHGQTYGLQAFTAGDSVAFVHPPSLQISHYGTVTSAELTTPREMLLEFALPIPKGIAVGDALENVTWTPSLTVRNCRIEGTNTRGMLVTTRRNVLIERNTFYRTGMHAILIENDASGWYESGPVTDVTIRDNVFEECGYNSFPHNFVIHINPQNRELVPGYYVHQHIRIHNNTFTVYDYPILSARSVRGLTFAHNRVLHTDFMAAGPARAGIALTGCTQVEILDNDFEPGNIPEIQLEQMKRKDIRSDIKIR